MTCCPWPFGTEGWRASNEVWLVVWLPFFFFRYIGFLIIPIDELIFFRGVAQPPTRVFLQWILEDLYMILHDFRGLSIYFIYLFTLFSMRFSWSTMVHAMMSICPWLSWYTMIFHDLPSIDNVDWMGFTQEISRDVPWFFCVPLPSLAISKVTIPRKIPWWYKVMPWNDSFWLYNTIMCI